MDVGVSAGVSVTKFTGAGVTLAVLVPFGRTIEGVAVFCFGEDIDVQAATSPENKKMRKGKSNVLEKILSFVIVICYEARDESCRISNAKCKPIGIPLCTPNSL